MALIPGTQVTKKQMATRRRWQVCSALISLVTASLLNYGKNGRFYQRPATLTDILGGLGSGVTARLDRPLGSVLATDFPLKVVRPVSRRRKGASMDFEADRF
jgi:hypothetical protein